MGYPVQSKPACGKGPKKFEAFVLAGVHQEMEDGGREHGLENGEQRSLCAGRAAIRQEKWNRDEESKQERREERMAVSAMPIEESGRAKVRAQAVEIGESAGQEDGECDGVRGAGKGDAFECVGGESVSEKVHCAEKVA